MSISPFSINNSFVRSIFNSKNKIEKISFDWFIFCLFFVTIVCIDLNNLKYNLSIIFRVFEFPKLLVFNVAFVVEKKEEKNKTIKHSHTFEQSS